MAIEFIQQNMMWVGLALVSGMMLIWPMLTGGSKDELSPAATTMKMNREEAVVLDVRDRKAGFEQVFMLSGGISAWNEANLPLTRKS